MNSLLKNSSSTQQCLILLIMDASNPHYKDPVLRAALIKRVEQLDCPCPEGGPEEKKVTVEILVTDAPADAVVTAIADKQSDLIIYHELRAGMVDLYHRRLTKELGSKTAVPRSYSLRPKSPEKINSSVTVIRSMKKLLKKEVVLLNELLLVA